LDQPVRVVVGLDLHDKAGLDAFLAQASDPRSPEFQHFLTQDQFNARYGPSADQEARVVAWLTQAGFHVTKRFPNRLLVEAQGTNAAAQAAFGVPVHNVLFQGQPHLAVLEAPRFPADVAAFATGVFGLDDLVQMQPMNEPRASVGGSCCSFGPNDIANFYDNGKSFTGSGQTVVIAGAYAWKDSDNTAYNSQFSLPAMPTGTAQVCVGSGSGCSFDSSQSIEIALDVEMVHAVAPAAVIKNYMAQTTALADFPTMYNQIVTDNPGHSVTSSWGSCESNSASSYQSTNDNIFANGNAIGQSWFAASGDHGSNDCNSLLGGTSVDHPANAPHMMGVGGTHANCSPAMTSSAPTCAAYGSETAWSGSGGGASAVFSKPSYQTGCSVPADGKRDVPDVSMEADTSPGNWVMFNGGWNVVGGTSDAAPQWGANFALLNQKLGGSGVGLPGTRIYQLCGTSSFHDVTSGSNGGFSAGVGYDRVTGVGTIDTNTLLTSWGSGGSASAPSAPASLTATPGNAQVSLSWSAAADGGSTVTNYKVYRGTTSGGETLLTTLGSVLSYTDTGVTNGQTYYYKVSAVNSVGEGPKSAEASATPSAPTTVLHETFDSGTGIPSGWNVTGLWHVASGCQGASSPANSLQYNQPSTCNYDTGATN